MLKGKQRPAPGPNSSAVLHKNRTLRWSDRRVRRRLLLWLGLNTVAVLAAPYCARAALLGAGEFLSLATAALIVASVMLIGATLLYWLGFAWVAAASYLFSLSAAISLGAPLITAASISLTVPCSMAILLLARKEHPSPAVMARPRVARCLAASLSATLLATLALALLAVVIPHEVDIGLLVIVHLIAGWFASSTVSGVFGEWIITRLPRWPHAEDSFSLERPLPAGVWSRVNILPAIGVYGLHHSDWPLYPSFYAGVDGGEVLSWQSQMQLVSIALFLLAIIVVAIIFYYRYARRLSEEVGRRQREMAGLNAISAAVSLGQDMDEVLSATLKEIMTLMQADAGCIHVSMAGEPLQLVTHKSLTPEQVEQCRDLPADHPTLQALFCTDQSPSAIFEPVSTTECDLFPGAKEFGSLVLLPIRTRGRTLGLIALASRNVKRLTEADRQLAASISHQVSIALEHARLLLATRQRLGELAGLIEVSQSLSGEVPDVDEALQEILEQCLVFLDGQRGIILQLLPEPADPLLRASVGHPEPTGSEADITIAYAEAIRRIGKEEGIIEIAGERDLTAVPLGNPHTPLGVLLFEGRPISQESRHILLTLADLAAMAILQEHSYASERRKRTLADSLVNTARLINESLTLDELLSCLLDQLRRIVGYSSGIIMLRQEGQPGQFRLAAIRGQAIPFSIPDMTESGESSPCLAKLMHEHKPILITDVGNDPCWTAVMGDPRIGSLLGIPLQSKRYLIGILFIISDVPFFYSEIDLELTSAFSQQAAIAIDKALMDRRLLRRFDEVTVLNEIARAVTSMINTDDILRFIIDQAQGLFDAEAASIALLAPEGNTLVFQMALGPGAREIEGTRIEMGQGIAGWVAQSGQPTRVADARQEARFFPGVDERTGFRTRDLMCAPMLVEGRVIGVIEILNSRSDTFSQEDLLLLTAISAQGGAALDRSRLYADMERRATQLETLLETAQAITSSLDHQAVLETIASRGQRLLAADGCTVYLLDASRRMLCPVVVMGEHAQEIMAEKLPIEKGLSGLVARSGTGLILNHAHLDPVAVHIPGTPYDPECLISVPLVTGNQTIGVMTVNRVGEREFEAEDLHFLSSLAAQASIAIMNARLYRASRDSAEKITALQEITKAVNSTLDLSSIIRIVDHQIGRIVPHKESSLALYVAEHNQFYRPAAGPEAPPAELTSEEVRIMRQALSSGTSITVELAEWRSGSGEIIDQPCSVVATPITAEREQLGVFMLVEDRVRAFSEEQLRILGEFANHLAIAISNARLYQERERAYRELEEAQQQLVLTEKLRALGQMASGIAHNFNNTLAVVLGRAELAMRRAGSEPLQKDLDAIARAARDGATTVRRLQDFTRLKPDEASLNIVDLNEVVEAVAEITRPRWQDQMQAEGRNVRLEVRTTSIPQVVGDAAELREVLTNMIFNALDAMPVGGDILLRTGTIGKRVLVSVQDSGIGIPEETRGRIFDPFFTTKGPQNSGLGLSTSFGIIARHGGEIRVESTVGSGSTFSIILPPAVESRQEQGLPRQQDTSVRPAHVLVVDDEPELGYVLQRALEEAGHRVTAFSSPQDAIHSFQRECYDVVVTDLGMPVLSGWDLTESLRQIDRDIPILMITGWGDSVDETLVQRHRIQQVIAKPFDISDLMLAISGAMRKRKHRRLRST